MPKLSNNQNGLSNGTLLVCMIINALGFAAKPMYLYSQFFNGMDTEVLLGKDFDISKLNDDSLGRLLDELYEYGVEKFYLEFVQYALQQMGYSPEYFHLDSTSFHLHGDEYNEGRERVSITIGKGTETEKKPVSIVPGYSRDSHPELAQVMIQMIVENQAGIPLFMKPQDGNTNDSKGFAESLDEVESLISALHDGTKSQYLVCDAALYTRQNLEDIYIRRENRVKFITRAPSKITDVAAMVARATEEGFEPIRDQFSGGMYDFSYAGVPQKILVVRSEQAVGWAEKSTDRRAEKELTALNSALKKLERKDFNCEPDARAEYAEIIKKYRYAVPAGEPKITTKEHFSKRGRRSADAVPDKTVFHISGSAVLNTELIAQEKEELDCFVIATNDTERNWTMEELLDGYKSQQRVERGFRFLKDPEFFADSIFLKTPERIEALLMVMVTTLFVYSSTEHMLRKNLAEKKLTVRSQVGKQISNPTMRWILSVFYMQAIGRFFIDDELFDCTDLTEDQATVVEALGRSWQEVYQSFIPHD